MTRGSTGNEAPITKFAENSGFLGQAAGELGALVVFAEHRFYGESMPFGNSSLDRQHIGVCRCTLASSAMDP